MQSYLPFMNALNPALGESILTRSQFESWSGVALRCLSEEWC